MKEFFGFGGFQRPAEGYFSWQHLTFVSILMVIMVATAIILGRRNRHRDDRVKNRILIGAALAIDGFELFKIVINCIDAKDPMNWVYDLPLFLCSIQLITIPLAAFTGGRMKEASLDFVSIFGLLGAVMGTYLAGNNYGTYPVLSFPNVVSGITHSISGFAALYIFLSGMASLKKRNTPISFGILLGFAAAAFVANVFTERNYMFLLRGDGTPYDIVYNLVGGNQVLYPLMVVGLFLVYIGAFYGIVRLIRGKKTVAA